MASFLTELRRRNVFRVGVAYAVAAWLLAQVAEFLLDVAAAPEWVLRSVVILLIIGFPLALIFAWAFELTPEGIKLEQDVDASDSTEHSKGRKLDFVVIAVLALAVVIFAMDKFVLAPDVSPTGELEQSIAVLPFVNMSADPDQEYFSDGIAEELLNQLTQIRGLKVAGRTSSFAFKGQNEDLRVIGEKLNVAHILEGSVRKAGDQVRITVQLISAADGYHLWSETFDRDLTNIFAIQEETAKSVADALSITLGVGKGDLGVGGTRNFAAYDAYLAGNSLLQTFSAQSFAAGIERLETAVDLDPDYAHAWSLLAFAYQTAAYFFAVDQSVELLEKSEAAASHAMRSAPQAFTSLRAAALTFTRNREWQDAERYLTKALEIAPSDYLTNLRYGLFLASVGRPQEAIVYLQAAARIEPLVLLPVQNLVVVRQFVDDFEGARSDFERGQELQGQQGMFNAIGLLLGMQSGDRTQMEKFMEAMALDPAAPENQPLTSTMLSLLDSPEEALQKLRQFYYGPIHELPVVRGAMSLWAAYFGDHEFALEILKDLFDARQYLVFALWQPVYKEMRGLPGFSDLVRDLNLEDYWRNTGNWGEFCAPVGHADFECH